MNEFKNRTKQALKSVYNNMYFNAKSSQTAINIAPVTVNRVKLEPVKTTEPVNNTVSIHEVIETVSNQFKNRAKLTPVNLAFFKGKKITLTTVKSFIRANRENLYINVTSAFDGMYDCCMSRYDGFVKAVKYSDNETSYNNLHSFNIKGAHFVFSSRDYFTEYENNDFYGVDVSNCCGSFILAIKKAPATEPEPEPIKETVKETEPENKKLSVIDAVSEIANVLKQDYEEYKEIATVILSQIGKGALYMIGAKNFTVIKNGVLFKIMRNSKNINVIKITLNGFDLYDVYFMYSSINGEKIIKAYTGAEGLYFDQLTEIIESVTGLATSLPRVIGINA